MKGIVKLARLEFVPTSADVGLAFLRVSLGVSMLLLHGYGKLNMLADGAAIDKFPDPLGVGHMASLVMAVIGEVGGSVLLCFGLLTRLGAIASAGAMAVAFFLVHKAQFGAGGGDLSFVYLAGYIAILIAGPGRFSLDARIFGDK